MFQALGQRLVRWRWLVIGLWAAAVVASLVFAPRVGSVLRAGGFSAGQIESQLAIDRIRADFDTRGVPVEVVFRSDSLVATDPEFVRSAAAALEPLRRIDAVSQITPFWSNATQVAPSGRTAYATVMVDVEEERAHQLVPLIRESLGPTDLEVHIAGGAVFYNDIQSLSESDLRRAEIIGLPFAVIALLLVFGSVVAAGIPVAAGGATVLVGLASIWAIGQVVDFSIFALNVVTLIGLGLGADYSLFLVSRFREELRAGRDVPDAVVRTVDTAGRAVVFSGLAVLTGLASLSIFEFMMLRSIGIGGSVVVLLALLAALTLVPAILAILGPNVNRLQIWRWRVGPRNGWSRLAYAVMRRPLPVFLGVSALLVLAGVPFLHVRVSAADPSVLTAASPSRQAYDLLVAEFGEGHVLPLVAVSRFPGGALTPDAIEQQHAFGAALEADPRVRRVASIAAIDPRITLEQYQLLYRDPAAVSEAYAATISAALVRGSTSLTIIEPEARSSSVEARDLVRAIRDYRDRHDLDLLLGGGAASLGDFVDRLYSDFPIAVGIILGITYIVLVILFRSLVLPLKAVLMNALSLLASFGVLVLVFQDGWLSGQLGFQPLGFIEATLPILLFALLFGLSMDYEVFLLARIKEAHDAGHDNATSVAIGLERSGRVITSAALVVIVVSLAFVTADIVLIKAVGLGAAIAVFVDATIVRSLLVPATMRLLGSWNWWMPGWLPLPEWRSDV